MRVLTKTAERLVFNFENFNGRDEIPLPTVEKVEFAIVTKEGETRNFLRILDQNPFAKSPLTAQFA
jgi:hypothetical protein